MNGDEIIDITDNQEPLGEETIEISSVDNNDVDIMAENVIYAEIPSEIIQEMQEDIAELQLESGASVVLSVNTTTYVLTLQLKNAAETVVSTTTVDLPLESVVVNGRYDSVNKKLILVLENGTEIEIPISDLINGLQEEITSENKLDSDLVDDTNQTNKFVTAGEKELISDIPDMQEFDEEVNEILPTVTGTGTELSLDGTKETRMEIDLKGNTEQASTEGKNLFNANGTYYTRNENTTLSISGNEITITNTSTVGAGFAWWNIPITSGQNYTISYIDLIENPENTNNHLSFKFNENPITEYTSDFTDYTQYTKLNKTNKVATAEATSNYITLVLRTTVEAVNKITGIQLEQGSTATEYEPYTNGASPNPDYPQDVHTVTGNNTISVCGKNLLEANAPEHTSNGILFEVNNDGTFNISGKATSTYSNLIATNARLPIYLNKNVNYTFWINQTLTFQFRIRFYDKNENIIATESIAAGDKYITFSLNENTASFYLYANAMTNGNTYNISNLGCMICEGTTIPTIYEKYNEINYPVNLGTIELCKIGDYQDEIRKSTGKNLFDKNNSIVTGKTYANDGTTTDVSVAFIQESYIDVLKDNYYTLSTINNHSSETNFRLQILEYDKNKNFIKRNMGTVGTGVTTSYTIQLGSTTKYVRLGALSSTLDELQLEQGSVVTEYEPYGKVWYLHKEADKVTLDGTEGWIKSNNGPYQTNVAFPSDVIVRDENTIAYCNKFKYAYYASSLTTNIKNGEIAWNGTKYLTIRIDEITTVDAFKTWLANNNVILYYPLETPTDTEITDTTLITQLNALDKAKSYDTQTNITQTNADLPFILTATAKADIHLEDYVKNTDYATGSVGGVLKQSSGRKFALDENGYPMVNTVTYADYGSLANGAFIGKGTLENVIAGKNLDGVYYGTCTTGATTQEKAVTCAGYRLQEGNVIYVKMTNGNTYNGVAKLNVNSTGAREISKGYDTVNRYFWTAGELVCFVYDGTNYIMTNKGMASTTYYGVTKLMNGATSTSTSTALTPTSLNQFSQTTISGYSAYSSSSTYAVGDRVRYNYGTYECITAITTAEAWTAEHWKLLDPLQIQIDNNKTYKTTETIVGEFLGKPLYRKVVNITATEYNALDTTSSRKKLPLNTDIKLILKADMVTNYNDGTKLVSKNYPMHMVNTGNSYDQGCHIYEDGFLQIYVGSSVLNGLIDDITIILEYTKTTD